jgi:alkylated DNA repair dioxygenase AlkB
LAGRRLAFKRSAEQADLFAGFNGPPGFRYRPEFVTVAEEDALLADIRALPLAQARYKDYTARRRVASFDGDTPAFLRQLTTRVAEWLELPARKLHHILVAEYQTGTPLGWHRDMPQYELVCGVSLGAACRMRFRAYAAPRRILSLELAPRSAYVLRDEVRWRWEHSIPAATALRYSITFRTLAQ